MSNRIRWEPAGSRIFGYAGTLEPWAFQVWQSPSDFGDVALGEWVLSIHLPGPFSEQLPHGHDPEKLKAEAERWLERFVHSLGAVFPAEDRATVNKTALEAFISDADANRSRCDSQFCISAAEYEASEAGFSALVAALDIKDADPAPAPEAAGTETTDA